MIKLKLNQNKKGKKINFKVIAAGFVAITLIGIVGISVGRFYGQSPVVPKTMMDGVTFIGENINKGFTFLKDGFADILNYKKNATLVDKLEEENSKLKQDIIDMKNDQEQAKSIESLKKGLNFVEEKYQAKSVASKVVGKNDGNWYNTMVIAAGKNQGIKKNSIVINGNGLVGVVYEVSENYSKAISLLDSKSSVSFKLLKNGEFKGILTQNTGLKDQENYKNKGYLYGYLFDSAYEVLPGDVIVTSGLGVYPEGIPIGEVDKVIEEKNKSMKYVTVKPYANFKNIDNVIVIEPRNVG